MDLFGGKPELRISGDSAFRTKFGATLTLLAAVGIFVQVLRTFRRLTDNTQPTVMRVSDIDLLKAQYDLTDSGLLPIFAVFNKYTGKILTVTEISTMMTSRPYIDLRGSTLTPRKSISPILEYL